MRRVEFLFSTLFNALSLPIHLPVVSVGPKTLFGHLPQVAALIALGVGGQLGSKADLSQDLFFFFPFANALPEGRKNDVGPHLLHSHIGGYREVSAPIAS